MASIILPEKKQTDRLTERHQPLEIGLTVEGENVGDEDTGLHSLENDGHLDEISPQELTARYYSIPLRYLLCYLQVRFQYYIL